MLTIRHFNRVAVMAMALTLGALVLDAHAAEQGSARGAKSACGEARQFEWFKRQLQLTDGDVNPFVQAQAPAECRGEQASQDLPSKSASASRSAPATSEIAQYSMPARRQ